MRRFRARGGLPLRYGSSTVHGLPSCASAFLSLLMAGLLLVSGCRFGEKRRTFSPMDNGLLQAKADPRLRQEAATGGDEPFAAIVVYRNDVFLEQSEALGQSSLTVLNEMGNSVILLLRPGEIVPLLKDPSLRKAAWFGPQGLLARLDPSLEIDMMSRYGAGTEDRDVDLLLRLVDVGGAVEERHVAAAGFRVLTMAGPTWIVAGPMSGLPKLLESDRIVYIEGASRARTMPRPSGDRRTSPAVASTAPVSRRLIVKFRPGTVACTAEGIAHLSSATRVPLEFVRTMSGDACVVKQTADGADTLTRGQETLRDHTAVEYLEPDTVVKALE